jgi:hypothetical protein
MPLYEIFCGVTSGFIVSPVMTIIDSSIIRSQLTNQSFKKSLLETSNDYLNKRINFARPCNIMLLVYSSTYTTANLTETCCKTHNIDYKIPTLFTTSFVNIVTIAYKDKEYSKIFNSKNHIFPKCSYILFAIRDMITISSNFIFKNDCKNFLYNYMPNNTADFIASLTLPIVAQTISTPLHILAIDIYQKPNIHFIDRIKNIKNPYKSVCLGRILRVIPAFCIGGFLNDMLRNRS